MGALQGIVKARIPTITKQALRYEKPDVLVLSKIAGKGLVVVREGISTPNAPYLRSGFSFSSSRYRIRFFLQIDLLCGGKLGGGESVARCGRRCWLIEWTTLSGRAIEWSSLLSVVAACDGCRSIGCLWKAGERGNICGLGEWSGCSGLVLKERGLWDGGIDKRKIHKFAWKIVAKEKDGGELGIGSVLAKTKAWIWKLGCNDTTSWTDFIRGKCRPSFNNGLPYSINSQDQDNTLMRDSCKLQMRKGFLQDIDLIDQSYEALKRQKKNADATQAASTAEDKSRHQDSVQEKPPEEAGADDMNPDRPESSSADDSRHETSGGEASVHTEGSGSQDVTMSEAEVSSHVDHIKRLFVEGTENYGIPLLERLYTRIMKGIFETKDKGVEDDGPRFSILRFLVKFAENTANF
ncbi:hypothetical protein NC651_036384 [Populus alba x Populus x berolinensis]|nr:hypothetical protein NC651_036384 [Populus alba x Populus x berolinensis]